MSFLFSLRVGRGQQKADVQVLRALAYDGQSANFAVDEVVTGGTSGATGRIVADTDGGTSGTLVLADVRGDFQNDEALTGSVAGVAVVNGTLALPSLTPSDQVVLEVDAEDFTKSDALAALRAIEQKIIEMPWPEA